MTHPLSIHFRHVPLEEEIGCISLALIVAVNFFTCFTKVYQSSAWIENWFFHFNEAQDVEIQLSNLVTRLFFAAHGTPATTGDATIHSLYKGKKQAKTSKSARKQARDSEVLAEIDQRSTKHQKIGFVPCNSQSYLIVFILVKVHLHSAFQHIKRCQRVYYPGKKGLWFNSATDSWSLNIKIWRSHRTWRARGKFLLV